MSLLDEQSSNEVVPEGRWSAFYKSRSCLRYIDEEYLQERCQDPFCIQTLKSFWRTNFLEESLLMRKIIIKAYILVLATRQGAGRLIVQRTSRLSVDEMEVSSKSMKD